MALVIRKNRSPKPPPCPIGACMAFLGGAWTPNIIWNLIGGPRRFGELRHDIPAISAKMLSARLKDLEAKGVVTRVLLATSPPSAEYALTELGFEMVPLIEAIAALGQKLTCYPKDHMSAGEKPGLTGIRRELADFTAT